MENTIMVKGTVHNPRNFTTRNGGGTSFNLSVFTGKKIDDQYPPSLWFNDVTIFESLSLFDKQKDVIVDGFFVSDKGKDGVIRSKLIAKRVLVPNATTEQEIKLCLQDDYGEDIPF
jgi:hypothetical protein